MRCKKARVLLTKRLYGALSPAEGSELESHLEGCPACRREQGENFLFEAQLRRLQEVEPPVPRFAPSLAAILSPGRLAKRQHSGARRGYLAAGGAALVAIGVGLTVLFQSPSSVTTAQRSAAQGTVPLFQTEAREPADRTRPRPQADDARPEEPASRFTEAAPGRPGIRTYATAGVRADEPGGAAQPLPLPDDIEYLNGTDPLDALQPRLPSVRDDFIHVPFPLLAGAGPDTPALGEAVQRHEKEAGIVDSRLFRKVTLQLKAVPLSEFCELLEKQTQVRLSVARGVADENVTVFVTDIPAREVMRAVARLFGYKWSRSGDERHFRYQLFQDLRSQLAEEEVRHRDVHHALLALDTQMEAFRPFLELVPELVQQRLHGAKGDEKAVLERLAGPEWGAVQIYHRLSPAERGALTQGQQLWFTSDSPRADRRIPEELRRPLLWVCDSTTAGARPRSLGQLADRPDAVVRVNLQLDHSELGLLSLRSNVQFEAAADPGGAMERTLATGQSPSATRPDNAAANRDLRMQPPFNQPVSLRPQPSCPKLRVAAAGRENETDRESSIEAARDSALGDRPVRPDQMELAARQEAARRPHVTAADVWAAVHRETDLPIVADAYTRLFDPGALSTDKATLFEALCRAADELGAHWQEDGGFILARSSSFFWDKLKEVPARDLERWQQARAAHRALPFDSLLEMAQLADQQLDSQRVAAAVSHCWGLPEWRLLGKPVEGSSPRPWLRWLAALPQGVWSQALSIEGLPLASLPPVAQQEVLRLRWGNLPPGALPGDPRLALQLLSETRVRFGYAPAGSYEWVPLLGPGRDQNQAAGLPVVSGATMDAALAAAQRIDRSASRDEIQRSEGTLCVTFIRQNAIPYNVAGVRPMQFRLRP